MTRLLSAAFAAALLAASASPAPGQSAPPTAAVAKLEREPPDSERRVAITKVQVALDRAGFRPGKIDGLGGEFTQKAAARYNCARGADEWELVDTSGIADPFREYTVTDEDLEWIGKTANTPAEQQKLSRMPYRDAWELVAEMFHCDARFLRELNPDLEGQPVVAGTVFRVPDAGPFRMRDVTELESSRREEAKRQKALAQSTPAPNPAAGDTDLSHAGPATEPTPSSGFLETAQSPEPTPTPTPEPVERRIVILRDDRIIELYENGQLAASFPCTPGSSRVPVPLGKWRITSNVLMPYFRYDKSVLRDGTRSDNAFNIPPGPNNYVGIVWMGINRPSVGIHGTQSPDQIGRNESSGCIRLSNWDAWFLCQRAEVGTPVEVR